MFESLEEVKMFSNPFIQETEGTKIIKQIQDLIN